MPGGRPSKFKPEYVDQARKLCAMGATDPELADFFGVSVTAIHRWHAEHPEFRKAVTESKTKHDQRVERRLYERAMGYEHDEVDIRVVDGKIVKTPIRKVYPPDTGAAIFWLKNRQPKRWRDIKAVELSGNGGEPIKIVATQNDLGLL